MTPYYDKYGATLYLGDCLEVLKGLPDNSVDSIVTDPPAGISFMGKDWDSHKGSKENWIGWMRQVAEQCLRVIKPGGHAVVWAIPRTSHWTGDAWEDAGWVPREKIYYTFGSGFPKNMDISKQIDKMSGAKREVVGPHSYANRGTAQSKQSVNLSGFPEREQHITAPAPVTEAAKQWAGWGTALKPAVEEWWVFRKPLSESTVAGNVLKHGTGALNIDESRVGTESVTVNTWDDGAKPFGGGAGHAYTGKTVEGRWPANLVHSGDPEVVDCFPDTQPSKGKYVRKTGGTQFLGVMGSGETNAPDGLCDSGSAARFFKCCPLDDEDIEASRLFYTAKASKSDREEGLNGLEEKDVYRYGAGIGEGADPNAPSRNRNHQGLGYVLDEACPADVKKEIEALLTSIR